MRQDWDLIEAEYLSSDKSYRALADEFEVSLSTLSKKAGKEKWTEKRQNIGNKVATEIADKIIADKSEKVFDAIAKIDWLIDQVEEKMQDVGAIKGFAANASVFLKAIAMRKQFEFKEIEFDDTWDSVVLKGDSEFNC